jgi:hypothetical protein
MELLRIVSERFNNLIVASASIRRLTITCPIVAEVVTSSCLGLTSSIKKSKLGIRLASAGGGKVVGGFMS